MTAPEQIVVTQAAREAVQAFHAEMARRLMSDLKSGTKLLDATGEDSDPIYQAFARFERDITRASEERIAGLVKALEDAKLGLGTANNLIFALSGSRSISVEMFIGEIDAALATTKATEGEKG